jgi:2'-5' RNA ligase
VLYVFSVPTWAPGVGDRVEAFRRRYEPARAVLVPAHVTFVFGVRALKCEELTARVSDVARQTAAFRVTFSIAEAHEDSIGGGYKLFLLADEGADALSALHRAMYAGNLECELRTDVPYRPHITVATADSAKGLETALLHVKALELPLMGRVDALQICAASPRGMETLAKFPLGDL